MYYTFILVWFAGAESPSNCEVVLRWDGREQPSISYREIETACDQALDRLGWHEQGALTEEQMKWLIRRGQARRCLFKYKEAFHDFAECYRTFPDVSTVAFEYARSAAVSDDQFHELDSIANSLTSQPGAAAMGNFLTGMSASLSGNWERAICAYSDALLLEPHWKTALEARAYCYYMCEHPELCVGDLEKASTWPESSGTPAGHLTLLRSAALTEMGQYEQARAILAAANHSPDVTGDAAMQSQVQLSLWIICAWQQKFSECTLLAESLVALTPKDALPHRLAALSYSAQGFEQRAMKSAEEALGLRGDKRSAWGTLGRVYYQKGDVENSLRCFVRCMDPATSASPAFQEDALWFAFVLATCPDDRFRNADLALTVLEKVKEKWQGATQDAQFLTLQAICLASSGRTVEAAELVRKAIEIPPLPGEVRDHFHPLQALFEKGRAYLHDPNSAPDQLIRISAASVIGCSKRPLQVTANDPEQKRCQVRMALSSVSGVHQSGYGTGHDNGVQRVIDRKAGLSSMTRWRLVVCPRTVGAQCLRQSRGATLCRALGLVFALSIAPVEFPR